jgi:hypothetical protein
MTACCSPRRPSTERKDKLFRHGFVNVVTSRLFTTVAGHAFVWRGFVCGRVAACTRSSSSDRKIDSNRRPIFELMPFRPALRSTAAVATRQNKLPLTGRIRVPRVAGSFFAISCRFVQIACTGAAQRMRSRTMRLSIALLRGWYFRAPERPSVSLTVTSPRGIGRRGSLARTLRQRQRRPDPPAYSAGTLSVARGSHLIARNRSFTLSVVALTLIRLGAD